MPGTDRRNSSSSEDANSLPPSRQISQDGSELIPTRMSKVSAPKPASNPLQFIKVGPCDLYKAAQEQIKKVEEIKKVEKVKDESEDWQSNLDNWKCSRRKRQEHIIERVVEVKKLELEEHDRNRKRSKTFNEMMEERTSKGGLRKMSLLAYPDDDSNDLSDLGLATSSLKSEEDFNDDDSNDLDNNQYHSENGNNKNGINGSNGHNGHRNTSEYESSTSATTSSPEPEEYTYERAIQGYMNFAETKIKIPIKNINETKLNGNQRFSPPKKETGSKIGEKLSELEQIRLRSGSTSDINGGKELPRVDIHKRRSLFENSESIENNAKSVDRVSKDLSNSKSIKERLSNLEREKSSEAINKTRPSEVSTTVKDRLTSLEKQKSSETLSNKRLSNGDISSQVSIKERLSSLEKQGEVDKLNKSSTDVTAQVSIKERVSNLDSACHKETTAKATPERDSAFKEKLENFKSTEKKEDVVNNRNCSEELDKKNFHRSLDCLDTKETSDRQSSFERVQSMEELETCGSPEEPVVYKSQSSLKMKEVSESVSRSNAEETTAAPRESETSKIEKVVSSQCEAQVTVLEENKNTVKVKQTNETLVEKNREVLKVKGTNKPVVVDDNIDKVDKTVETLKEDDQLITDDPVVDTADNTLTDKPSDDIKNPVVDTADNTLTDKPSDDIKNPVVAPVKNEKVAAPVETETPLKSDESSASLKVETQTTVVAEVTDNSASVENEVSTVVQLETESLSNGSKDGASSVKDDTKSSEVKQDEVSAPVEIKSSVDAELNNDEMKNPKMKDESTALEDGVSLPAALPEEEMNDSEAVGSAQDGTTVTLAVPQDKSNLSCTIFVTNAESSDQDRLPEEQNLNVSLSVSHESEEDDDFQPLPGSSFAQRVKPGSDKLLKKNKGRVRKLTPILTPPPGAKTLSPTRSPCDLQIIEEGDLPPRSNQEAEVTLCMSHVPSGTSDIQEMDSKPNLETLNLELEDPEENGLYTDENIDEVLGDEGEVEEEGTPVDEAEMVTRFDVEVKRSPVDQAPLTEQQISSYENVVIANQIPQLNAASGDVEIIASLCFPLGHVSTVEPPKEKPPPPPLEMSDEEEAPTPELPPKPSVRRLDSTKRIKKEIRKKRSDFLGIEGANDDSYLEPEVYVAPPPDMMSFLQEERRLEQQLYRQSICSESDSNHETAESRDSGVELDRGHVDELCWSKQAPSEQHSRQNSETFGNTSITSEEDEIMKKEREIIEVLEKEEQWRYGHKNCNGTEDNDIGEKLAVKLRQLEQEKMQLEWERAEEEGRRQAEEAARREDEERLKAKEQALREQENSSNSNTDSSVGLNQEALRSERERLQKEHEELERCRATLLQQQHTEQLDIRPPHPHWDTPSTRHSLQEAPVGLPLQEVPRRSMQDVSSLTASYRYSLPDLQSRPTPPVPPAKPLRPLQPQYRVPSADNLLVEPVKLRHGSSTPHVNHATHGGQGTQQMTRSTLHALSATPRSRLITSENWMQPKRKPDAPKSSYNYQHWLIQEAEHRRIIEQQQRVANQMQSRRSLPGHGHAHHPLHAHTQSAPSHHTHTTVGLPTSPPHRSKPLPDSVIQTLTQRVQNRVGVVPDKTSPRRRLELSERPPPSKSLSSHALNTSQIPDTPPAPPTQQLQSPDTQERMLSVSGKKKCSHCDEELGRGAAMIIESLRLFYHIDCFKCCVCHVQLGDGLIGTDVRVRNNKLHCHNCYSSDDGVKFSCV